MKYWSENGSFDLTSRARSQDAEKVHDCFGRVLADMIVAGAQIPGNHQKDQK